MTGEKGVIYLAEYKPDVHVISWVFFYPTMTSCLKTIWTIIFSFLPVVTGFSYTMLTSARLMYPEQGSE